MPPSRKWEHCLSRSRPNWKKNRPISAGFADSFAPLAERHGELIGHTLDYMRQRIDKIMNVPSLKQEAASLWTNLDRELTPLDFSTNTSKPEGVLCTWIDTSQERLKEVRIVQAGDNMEKTFPPMMAALRLALEPMEKMQRRCEGQIAARYRDKAPKKDHEESRCLKKNRRHGNRAIARRSVRRQHG